MSYKNKQKNQSLKYKKTFFFQKSEEKRKEKDSKKQNAILLVLTIEEISLQPELSSPPHFRIQGGSTELDGAGQTNEPRKSLCLI